MKFTTKLWKRSNKSFATTIPHIALLTIDENKDYKVVWEFNQKIQSWTFKLKEIRQKNNHKIKENIKENIVKENEIN